MPRKPYVIRSFDGNRTRRKRKRATRFRSRAIEFENYSKRASICQEKSPTACYVCAMSRTRLKSRLSACLDARSIAVRRVAACAKAWRDRVMAEKADGRKNKTRGPFPVPRIQYIQTNKRAPKRQENFAADPFAGKCGERTS